MSLNVWRIIADLSHTVSKCILIWAIHANASAEGVSLITQALYAVVFCTRYVDLFWSHPLKDFRVSPDAPIPIPLGVWNFTLKLFYIISSLYILFIMLRVYGRTHEREKAWKFGYGCLGGSLLLAPFTMLIFMSRQQWSLWEFVWNFSEILESVCVLPQLLLLRQTSVPTVIDSFYLVTLGCYRFFYIPNWILISSHGGSVPTVSLIFGMIQTAFYIDFAWVYYSRQRVKLRQGALVDSEDFTKGWLVNRILGRAGFKGNDYDGAVDGRNRRADPEFRVGDDFEDEETSAGGINRPRTNGSQGGWGKRGVSVSADDNGPPAPKTRGQSSTGNAGKPAERQGMLDNLNDEDYDDDAPSSGGAAHSEWK